MTKEQPTWTCPAGTIQGWEDDGVLRATGIRYAAGTRFGLPTSEPQVENVIDATKWSPCCPQPIAAWVDDFFNKQERDLDFDEHSQYLSITIPADRKPDEQLPVMVWIHGGSYTSGAGDLPIFEPAPFVREQRVIVVAVTYRLGLLGFLGDGDHIPANLGLHDQIAALQWINRNIPAFGGDSKNITLFGQSAGGDAIAHLMIARGTEGLFQRTIIQSAPFGIVRGRERMTAKMLAEAEHLQTDATLDEILTSHDRVHNSAAGFGLMSGMPFGVQYGHDPLPTESELDEAWTKAASRIEVLVGCAHREVSMFAPTTPALVKMQVIPIVGRHASEIAIKAVTRKIYGAGVRQFSNRHQQGGGKGYRYLIEWGVPGNPFAGSHCIDLPLLFGEKKVWDNAPLVRGATWEEIDQKGKQLREIWAGFARDGQICEKRIPGLIKIVPI